MGNEFENIMNNVFSSDPVFSGQAKDIEKYENRLQEIEKLLIDSETNLDDKKLLTYEKGKVQQRLKEVKEEMSNTLSKKEVSKEDNYPNHEG